MSQLTFAENRSTEIIRQSCILYNVHIMLKKECYDKKEFYDKNKFQHPFLAACCYNQ